MTKALKEAIEVLRELPEERQEFAAEVLETIAAQDDGVYHLTDEERTEVREGLSEIKRGDIASESDMQALWKKLGL